MPGKTAHHVPSEARGALRPIEQGARQDGRLAVLELPAAAVGPTAGGARRTVLMAYALIAVQAALLYVPYVISGGYIADDWGYLKNAQDFPRYWAQVRHYFPLMSHRPLVPFVAAAQTLLVGDRPWVYALVNLACWFGFVAIACRALREAFGHVLAVGVAALAMVPVLASSVVYWPLAMTGATLSCLLWAVSFLLVMRGRARGRYRLWAYLPLVACMFMYEAVLPLFALTVLLPLLRPPGAGAADSPARRLVKYALPPVVVAMLPLLSQKLLLPWLLPRLGSPGQLVSRIHLTPDSALQGGASWLFALLPGQVLLWSHGLWSALKDWTVALRLLPAAGAGLAALALAVRADRLGPRPACLGRPGAAGAMLLCLAAGSLVCLFSGQLAYFSGGCGNRILFATWIGQALVLAWLAADGRARWRRIPVALVLVASTAGMIVQQDNCIRSWRLQQQVRASFVAEAERVDMTPGATVVADVPRVVGGSYFHAAGFQTPWDWGSVVAMPLGARGDQGAVVGLNQPQGLEVTREGGRITIHDWWRANLDEVWFFRYDPQSGAVTLRPIDDGDDWDRLIRDVKERNLNPRPDTIEERLARRFLGGLGM